MLAENLFDKIGFTDYMINEYENYKNIIKDKFENLARQTVFNNENWIEACMKAKEIVPEIQEYTSDLMFIIECTGYLLQKYRKNKIPDHMFYNAMLDIFCKTRECINIKGVFGTFVFEWFGGFFDLTRFAFGRLQYDITRHFEEDIELKNLTIKKGDLVLKCHIPSLGPLLHEDCIESYKKAFAYFKNILNGKPLVIRCDSWLLMPDYMEMFKECSPNIYNFASDYEIFDVNYSEIFKDAWRIFNTDIDPLNTESLPQNTRLQKGFVKHINNGGKFGSGKGILLVTD